MSNGNSYGQIVRQHEKFFQYTGWMLVGIGIVAAVAGAYFVRVSRRF